MFFFKELDDFCGSLFGFEVDFGFRQNTRLTIKMTASVQKLLLLKAEQ
jgi:hypothetical protein